MSRRLAAALLVASLAGVAAAAPTDAEVRAQNPAPVNAFELEAGRRFDRSDGGRDESHYRISYRGALLRAQGTPFRFSEGLDLTAPALPPAQAGQGAGDRPQWTLKLEDRGATLGGSLLEAEGAQPIRLAGLERLDLRGSASLATDEQGTRVALGLESPPLRIPGLAGREITNWVIVGANAVRGPAASGTGTQDDGVLTLRAFVGKAFGWRAAKGPELARTAARIEEQILAQAKTLADARVLARRIRAAAASSTPSDLQSLLLDVIDTAANDADWQRAVRAAALQEAQAIQDRPTLAAYAESTGWYRVSGGSQERRWHNLFTATLDWWFLPDNDTTLLRLRYEHGRSWAEPALRREQWFASLVLRL